MQLASHTLTSVQKATCPYSVPSSGSGVWVAGLTSHITPAGRVVKGFSRKVNARKPQGSAADGAEGEEVDRDGDRDGEQGQANPETVDEEVLGDADAEPERTD